MIRRQQDCQQKKKDFHGFIFTEFLTKARTWASKAQCKRTSKQKIKKFQEENFFWRWGKKQEEWKLPDQTDYYSIPSLSSEARQKLTEYTPTSLRHASRISGVTPADIDVLTLWIKKNKKMLSNSTDAANNGVAPVLASSSNYTLSRWVTSTPCSSSASATLKTGSKSIWWKKILMNEMKI